MQIVFVGCITSLDPSSLFGLSNELPCSWGNDVIVILDEAMFTCVLRDRTEREE